MYKLDKDGLQKLVDAACDTWKKYLVQEFAFDIFNNGFYNVVENQIKVLKSEANEKQIKVINEVFGIEEKEDTYFVGDYFEYDDEFYVLSKIKLNNKTNVVLICINDGLRWRDHIEINSLNKITPHEFEKISGRYPFKKVTKEYVKENL